MAARHPRKKDLRCCGAPATASGTKQKKNAEIEEYGTRFVCPHASGGSRANRVSVRRHFCFLLPIGKTAGGTAAPRLLSAVRLPSFGER